MDYTNYNSIVDHVLEKYPYLKESVAWGIADMLVDAYFEGSKHGIDVVCKKMGV